MRSGACAHAVSCLLLLASGPAPGWEWSSYAADPASTRFAPLSQIDGGNFHQLREVWRYTAPDKAIAAAEGLRTHANKGTPVVADGVLYYGSPFNVLCAVDPATGEELWTFDPRAWEAHGFSGISRGVAYWRSGPVKRVFYGTASDRLYSIDAETGRPDPAFGDGGFVDLGEGLRRPIDRESYCVTSPPIVCRGVVVVGAGIADWHAQPPEEYSTPGDVRGFDARTGEQVWVFHTVPQEGEPGNETWENEAWRNFGQANVWSAMSADEELGYVYLPTSATTHNYYGGDRPGANLFSQSLVCVEAATGRRVWHYQMVHHGLWNYDLSAPPVLADITVGGRRIKALAQVSKQAFCYVLDRTTGEPVWPIEEGPVPVSKTPGERSWPTQPFPTRPAPYDHQGLQEENLIDFTPELRRKALDHLREYEHGPLFTPPSEKGTLVLPGGQGATDWNGAALVPGTNVLYVPSRTEPDVVRVEKVGGLEALVRPFRASDYASFKWDDPFVDGLPLTRPPYGRVTAIDLDTGEHLWMSPVGRGPVNHPALRGLDLPPLGWFDRSFPLATETVLVLATGFPRGLERPGAEAFVEPGPRLRAFDLETGAVLAELKLRDNPGGSPISYMVDGRQYLVIPINGYDSWAPQLLALALPEGDS